MRRRPHSLPICRRLACRSRLHLCTRCRRRRKLRHRRPAGISAPVCKTANQKIWHAATRSGPITPSFRSALAGWSGKAMPCRCQWILTPVAGACPGANMRPCSAPASWSGWWTIPGRSTRKAQWPRTGSATHLPKWVSAGAIRPPGPAGARHLLAGPPA